ncbi:serine/threonine protein kinase [Micromonospora sp. SCSIO 07396]
MPDVTPLNPRDPRQAGPYELIGRLGAGGQGVVYLGRDEQGRWVAVKVINVDLHQHPRAKAQFVKEIAAARRVAPFCTAQILFADVDGELPYVVSEFIEGVTLQRHVREQGPVAGNALHRLAVGTATALAAIHQSDVVHCDLKPDNVILAADGPRVIDFGIARALDVTETMTSRIMGTATYMAPERFRDDEVGPASDVFAWAGTIAFAAGGQPPFGTGPVVAVMHRVLHDPPDLTGLTGPLATLIGQCLDKDHRVRPTAQEVLLRLLGRDAHPSGEVPLQTVLRAGTDAAATRHVPRTVTTTPPAAPAVAAADPWPTTAAAVDPWPTTGMTPARPDTSTGHPVPQATGDQAATPWPATSTAHPAPQPPTAPAATAWSAPAPPATTDRPATVTRDGFGRRLRRQWTDPWGMSLAVLLGAVGFATGYVASTDVGTAVAVGLLALVVVYGVRLLVAAALTPAGPPDGPVPQPGAPPVPAPRADA